MGDSGEVYSLQGNPCFSQFVDCDELFEIAAARQWVVLAPVTASLKFARITNDFVRMHILRRSPYYKDKFCTLDEKEVEFDGKTISVGARHWPEARSAQVLDEELYYDSNFQSFRVLHISQPLVGRSSAPGAFPGSPAQQPLQGGAFAAGGAPADPEKQRREDPEEEDGDAPGAEDNEAQVPAQAARSSAVPTTPAQWWAALVQLAGAPAPQLFARAIRDPLQLYVRGFNDGFVLVKGERFMKLTAQQIQGEIQRLCGHALQVLGKRLSPEEAAQFQVHVENLVMAGIYQKLFNSLKLLYEEEEAQLRDLIFSLQSLSMEELHIRPEIVCQPNLAIRRLALLDSRDTPVGKLRLLMNVNALLQRAISEQCRPRASPLQESEEKLGEEAEGDTGAPGKSGAGETDEPDLVLNADDVLPLTIFLVVQAYTKTDLEMHLCANLLVLEHFVLSGAHPLLAQLRVHQATFLAAVEFLRSGRLDRLARAVSGSPDSALVLSAARANRRISSSLGGAPASSPAPAHSRAGSVASLASLTPPGSLSGPDLGSATKGSPGRERPELHRRQSSNGAALRMANARSWGTGPLPGSLPASGSNPALRSLQGSSVEEEPDAPLRGWRDRLTEFFRRYDPPKLARVDLTLEAFREREQLLFDSLYEKYGVPRDEQRLWQMGTPPAWKGALPAARSPQGFGVNPPRQHPALARSRTLDPSMNNSASRASPKQLHELQQRQNQQQQQQQQQQQLRSRPSLRNPQQHAAPDVVDLQDDLQGLMLVTRR